MKPQSQVEKEVKKWLSQGTAREWPEVVEFIANQRTEDLESVVEIIKNIEAQGGGSGRRIKEQLLAALQSLNK